MDNFSLPVLQPDYDVDTIYDRPLVEITQSALTTFMACPQRYVFRYLMRLSKMGVSIPLLVGSAVHKGLEVLMDPDSPLEQSDKLPFALQAVESKFLSVTKDVRKIIGIEDKVETGRAQAHALVTCWNVINADTLSEWTLLRSEMKIRSKPTATVLSPHADRRAGMIDGVVKDQDGTVWIAEHKTRRAMGDLNANSLNLDAQALWYIVMCYEQLQADPGWEAGMPKGFLYDALQKPQHRLNAMGFEDLRNRMIAAILADPSKYLSVIPILIEPKIVDMARRNFSKIIHLMDTLNPHWVYMNTKSCDDFGGCPYKPLCQNGAQADNPRSVFDIPQIDLYEILPPHTELEDEAEIDGSLDKWGGFGG